MGGAAGLGCQTQIFPVCLHHRRLRHPGAFYRDVAPNHYYITVDSAGRDFNQVADAKLAAGQEAYAKIVSLRSWLDDDYCITWSGCDTFYVWLIPADAARPAIADNPFYGGLRLPDVTGVPRAVASAAMPGHHDRICLIRRWRETASNSRFLSRGCQCANVQRPSLVQRTAASAGTLFLGAIPDACGPKTQSAKLTLPWRETDSNRRSLS
jgi:hypothetical protein